MKQNGAENGAESFLRHLPLLNMRYVPVILLVLLDQQVDPTDLIYSCDLDPKRIAVWYSPTYKLRLSALAAQVLIEAGEIEIKQLTLHRTYFDYSYFVTKAQTSGRNFVGPREYDTEIQAGDPLTGSLGPLFHMPVDVGRSLAKLSTGRPDKAAVKLLGVVPKCEFPKFVVRATLRLSN